MFEYQAKKEKNETKLKDKNQAKKSNCSFRIIPSWLRHLLGEAFLSNKAIRHAQPHHRGTNP
jgi:hypothetical protein